MYHYFTSREIRPNQANNKLKRERNHFDVLRNMINDIIGMNDTYGCNSLHSDLLLQININAM